MGSLANRCCMSIGPLIVQTAPLTGSSYFTSVFVSLGVFLFGYDQGVMSGIITYDVVSLTTSGKTLNDDATEVLTSKTISTSQHEPRSVPWWPSSRSAHSCPL